MQKTGTSSLQKFLLLNREKLSSRGFYYPVSNLGGTPAHHFFSEAAKGGVINKIDARYILPTLRELYHPLLYEMQSHETSIVSSEGFQNCNPYLIKELFKNFDVTVVLYLRNEIEFITSSYAQKIHATTSTETPEDYVNRSEINYGQFLDGWNSAFDGKVLPRIFARKSLYHGDIIEDFLHEFLELDQEGFEFKKEDGNPSLTNSTLKAKFHLNILYTYPKELRHLVYSHFQQQALKDNSSGKAHLDEKLLSPLADRFKRLQSYWAPKYFDLEEIFDYNITSSDNKEITSKEIHAITQPLIAKANGRIQPKASIRIE